MSKHLKILLGGSQRGDAKGGQNDGAIFFI
jgi:hypothetical protein